MMFDKDPPVAAEASIAAIVYRAAYKRQGRQKAACR